jgi:hypothetical protein
VRWSTSKVWLIRHLHQVAARVRRASHRKTLGVLTLEFERWAVLREYDSSARKNPDLANKGDPMLFFSHLESERPDLLDFKSRSVGKWQRVHGWLKSAGRVKK